MNASERGGIDPMFAIVAFASFGVFCVTITEIVKAKYADSQYKDCIENGTAIIEGKRYICVPYEVQEAALPE